MGARWVNFLIRAKAALDLLLGKPLFILTGTLVLGPDEVVSYSPIVTAGGARIHFRGIPLVAKAYTLLGDGYRGLRR